MNLRLFGIIALIIFTLSIVEALPTVYNPFTGKLDYYGLNNNTNLTQEWFFGKLNFSFIQNVPSFLLIESDPLWNANSSLVRYKNENISWSNLSNFPISCPNGTAITQLGNAVTCSTFLNNISGNNKQVQFNDNGILGASNGFVFNKTKNWTGVGLDNPTFPMDLVGEDAPGYLQLLLGNSMIDDSLKVGGFAMRHYDNQQKNVGGLVASSTGTENQLYWGGGAPDYISATSHWFYTASDAITSTGTNTFSIDYSNVKVLNGANFSGVNGFGSYKFASGVGGLGDLQITATGGDISFDNERLYTTGTINVSGYLTNTKTGKTTSLLINKTNGDSCSLNFSGGILTTDSTC